MTGTESVSARFADLDQWSTGDAVAAMLDGQLAAVAAVQSQTAQIAAAADAGAERLLRGGRLIYAGAGTSGRVAAQDGVELRPTFGWPAERLAFVIAGGLAALTHSAENAEDNAASADAAMTELGIRPDDVAIGVAASGTTPFTIAALRSAKAAGALTIGVTNNPATPLLDVAQIGICASTGSEIIAGSTRMKAGTAQKVVLNLLSTAMMIRCGRVYGGQMVDMVISNRKLRKRAIAMVERIAGVSPDIASHSLEAAQDHIKTAVLLAMGADLQAAAAALATCGDRLREAMAHWQTNSE